MRNSPRANRELYHWGPQWYEAAGGAGPGICATKSTRFRQGNCSELVRRIGGTWCAGGWLWGRWLCHITGMDTEIDLRTADRDVLIGIIVRQQAIIERLEKCIAQLEGQAKPKGSRRMPGLKPKADREPARPKEPRKPRPHGFARARMTPTHRVEHVVEQCPDCGTQLSWGLGPAHSGGDRPAAGSGAGNRARLPDPHLSPLPTLLCSQSATGRRGDGQAAPGDQRHQPDCGPAGGSQAAVAHHPVAPGYRAWAATQPGGHRGGHTASGWQGPTGGGGHPGTGPRQSGGPRR